MGKIVYESNLKGYKNAMKEAKIQALTAIILVAEDKSVQLVPVDTSRLRSSITHYIDSNGKFALLGTNVEYAAFVELGTFKQSAQPYIRPALEGHEKEYQAIAQRYLNKMR